jgi:hypothetical protein
MAAELNLKMETNHEQVFFVQTRLSEFGDLVHVTLRDGTDTTEAFLDSHELDMLIALLSAAKAQLTQARREEQ